MPHLAINLSLNKSGRIFKWIFLGDDLLRRFRNIQFDAFACIISTASASFILRKFSSCWTKKTEVKKHVTLRFFIGRWIFFQILGILGGAFAEIMRCKITKLYLLYTTFQEFSCKNLKWRLLARVQVVASYYLAYVWCEILCMYVFVK